MSRSSCDASTASGTFAAGFAMLKVRLLALPLRGLTLARGLGRVMIMMLIMMKLTTD
jgi:hypothetical protein